MIEQLVVFTSYQWDWLYANPESVMAAGLMGLLAGWAVYIHREGHMFTTTGVGDHVMFTMQREQHCMEAMSDMVECGIDDMIYQGIVTKAEGRVWKRRFANILELKDLLPRGQLTLRETIKADRATRVNAGQPVPLPDLVLAPATQRPKKDMRNFFN